MFVDNMIKRLRNTLQVIFWMKEECQFNSLSGCEVQLKISPMLFKCVINIHDCRERERTFLSKTS